MTTDDTPDVCDIFDSALCALFAVPPIGFSTSSPSEAHVYTPPSGAPVRLWLPHPPASIHAALQANHLWLSAVFLADRIAAGAITFPTPAISPTRSPTSAPPSPPSAPTPLSTPLSASALSASVSPPILPTVLELGAGAGLPSIMAARAGARVTCTDYDDAVVVDTIRRNFLCDKPGDWAVLGHSWGTDVSPLLKRARGGYDAVLLADTLWSSDKHGILLDSVCALLVPAGVVHVAAGLHTGRGPIARFIELARARGLEARWEAEVQWLPGGGWGAHECDEHEGLQEERGVVVYHTLRWAQ